MPTGTVSSYDADDAQGFLVPDSDSDGDEIPFDEDALDGIDPATIREGMRVEYDVEGGMAGLMATHVRPHHGAAH